MAINATYLCLIDINGTACVRLSIAQLPTHPPPNIH